MPAYWRSRAVRTSLDGEARAPEAAQLTVSISAIIPHDSDSNARTGCAPGCLAVAAFKAIECEQQRIESAAFKGQHASFAAWDTDLASALPLPAGMTSNGSRRADGRALERSPL